jgi:hypothetical protein
MNMNRTSSRYVSPLILAVLLIFCSGWIQNAWALDLRTAKSQGMVGEMSNGYLGVIKSSGEVQALVKQVNDARRKHYTEIAKRNGTSLEVVELLAGKKAIEMTPAGQYVKPGSGGWVRK